MKAVYFIILFFATSASAQTFQNPKRDVLDFAGFQTFDRDAFVTKKPVVIFMGYTLADPQMPKIDAALISFYYGSEYINQFARTNLHYNHPSANTRGKGLIAPTGNLEVPKSIILNGLR